jgi:two-component system, NarL family, nitrate/nitrite response regulator NarL
VFALSAAKIALNADAFEWGERKVKILICNRQRMLAEALASALDAHGYDVLAVTMTVSDALGAADGCTPDVCLLGLPSGRGWSGPDAVRAILQRYPGTKVLVLLEVADRETLAELKRSGVGGVTHQDQSVAEIASALDAIEAGRNVLDPGPLQAPAPGAKRMCDLSPREWEIVARIVGGQSTRQMSFAMNITVDTVRTYVKNVLAKLGAHSRLQLAALASREGLLIDHPLAAGILGPGEDAAVGRPYRGPLLEQSSGGRSRGW